jgi:hypothetical protein
MLLLVAYQPLTSEKGKEKKVLTAKWSKGKNISKEKNMFSFELPVEV